MKTGMKRVVTLTVAAIAAFAATAAAAADVVVYRSADNGPYYFDAVTGEYHYGLPPATDTYVVEESMPYYVARPDPGYYVVQPEPYYVGSADDVYYVEPPITVYSPRDEDVAINNDVVDTIASDARVSGKIGVQTFRREVTLNGRVGTNGQRTIAETDAYSVDGVDRVNNKLHAAVGEW